MHRLRQLAALGATVLLAGCYHQVVETGLPAGSTTITKGWHPTWIFGLVAATPIDVRSECPSGVAYASTRMTFANGLVGGLTFGIFTPHEVKITCASRGALLPGTETVRVATEATPAAVHEAVGRAAFQAFTTGRSVALVVDPAVTR
jgi:hypothetical protein